MIYFIWTALFAADPQPPTVLEIPHFLNKPKVTWADLNGDGTMDIWLADGKDQLWVWDGQSPEHQFQAVAFEPDQVQPVPHWTENGWAAGYYDHGSQWVFKPDSGWLATTDYNVLGRVRPGLNPIKGGEPQWRLVGTFDGYRLMEGMCQVYAFPIFPSIQLNRKTLTMDYPIPTWRDLDGDGVEDLISAPVQFRQGGEIGVWKAIRGERSWDSGWWKLQFPDDLKIETHQFGDLDGDGLQDLMVLAMPGKDISLFEELSFVVYLGTGPGQWEPVPSQVLKTKQNLWQTGPVEMNDRGIFLYYYKGIFNSHFKIDRFAWNEDGFVEPKPISQKWTLKKADRDHIFLDHDFNGDGLTDLVLVEKRGVTVYYRRDRSHGLPFDDRPDQILLAGDANGAQGDQTLVLGGTEIDLSHRSRLRRNRLKGHGSLALVDAGSGEPASLWTLIESGNGFWYVKRLYPAP